MLPSRGLRPAQLAASGSRQSLILRSNASRKFSSLPRTSALSASSSRSSPLQSTNWRSGANSHPLTGLAASTVRYGSWYAPWSWGRSNTPATDANPNVPVEFAAEPAAATEPVAAAASLPESAVPLPESTPVSADPKTIEELLGMENVPTPDVTPLIDPTLPINHIGHMKELGLDFGWGPSALVQWVIEHVHLMSGLEWGGTVVVSTIMLRIALFPLQRKTSNVMAQMAALKPVLQPLQDEMEQAKLSGNSTREEYLKHKQQQIYKEIGPAVIMTPAVMIAQGALGYGAWRTLTGASNLPIAGMSDGGWAWFSDLTVSDPYFVLPAAVGSVSYVLMKKGGETGLQNDVPNTSMRNFIRYGFPGLMFAITVWQPAAIQLYFLCSTMLGAVSGNMLRSPTVRKLLRMVPLPTPESNALYSKVAKGQIKLNQVKSADGTIRYQAPTKAPAAPSAKTGSVRAGVVQNRGINIKAGTAIPAHLRQPAPKIDKEHPDRDIDYHEGLPKGFQPVKQLDWIRRNYNPKYIWRRTTASTKTNLVEETRRDKAKKRAEDYEIERRRRFENRR